MSEKFRKDLTQGSVTKQLLKFSVPFLLSNLLQALYSVADMVIVGQFCGKSGITGVSIGGQINILVTGAALGLAIGGTVLIAQYGGAKKYDDQKSTIGTMTTLYIILSAVLTVVMVLLTKPILRLLKTPDNAFEEAVKYLTICMLGTVFMFLYNAISAILRGMGALAKEDRPKVGKIVNEAKAEIAQLIQQKNEELKAREMQQRLEREKIEEEYQEVLKAIEDYKAILADESRILGIIKDELKAVKAKFGDARRTRLTVDTSEIDVEDLIAEEDVVITLTHNNYIKRMALDTYRRQNRGGKGLINLKVTEKTGDVIGLRVVHPDQELMLITTEGIVIRTNISDISVISRNTQGVKLMSTSENDIVASMAVMDQKN